MPAPLAMPLHHETVWQQLGQSSVSKGMSCLLPLSPEPAGQPLPLAGHKALLPPAGGATAASHPSSLPYSGPACAHSSSGSSRRGRGGEAPCHAPCPSLAQLEFAPLWSELWLSSAPGWGWVRGT